jgi:hypothetical protein
MQTFNHESQAPFQATIVFQQYSSHLKKNSLQKYLKIFKVFLYYYVKFDIKKLLFVLGRH